MSRVPARIAVTAALLGLALDAAAGRPKRGDDNVDVDLEEACPTTPPEGYRTWVGNASGPDKGAALKAAREDALAKAKDAACAGFGALRCAAIRRNMSDWKNGYWDPETGAACAAVALKKTWLDSLERDIEEFARNVDQLAVSVVPHLGDAPLRLEPAVWNSGCAAGEVGAALSETLRNALAYPGSVRLVPDGATDPGAAVLRLKLTPSADEVILSASVQPAGETALVPLGGFSFPLDVFDVAADETGTCRSDRALGLMDGARVGEDGRRVWIAVASDSGLFCEGDHLEPIVMVSQPSRLRVYSVAHDGDAYLIWPPPGHGDRVDGRLSLGRVDLVALPEEGDERLLAVAAPAEGSLGVTNAWEGFCRVPGEFSEAFYPSGAAVGTRTFTVLPPGSGECAAGTPQGESVKAALAAAPRCGQH
jgi:hypothetical protein